MGGFLIEWGKMDNEKKSLIKWIPEEKIIILTPEGDFNKENAKIIVDRISEIIDRTPEDETIKLVVDDTGTNKTDYEARRIYTEFAKKYSGRLSKLAVFGANTFVKLAVRFIMSTIGREKDFKFFDNVEDSLNWIKKQK